MPVLRYARQEAANIAKAAASTKQAVALNAYRAKAEADIGLASVSDTKLGWTTAPATAADPGEVGQVAHDGSFLYVCISADTWARTALSTW